MISTIEDIYNSTTATEAASTSKTVDQDTFLQLLIAQMQNQDPLDPMDNTDYTSVLTQFSSLAQLNSISSKLDDLAEAIESSTATNITNLIGREVSAAGDTVSVSGSSTSITYNLPEDAASCEISVYAEDGDLVASFYPGAQSAGQQNITWDTSDISSGNYSVQISAYDSSGNAITTDSIISGTVTAITAGDGTLCIVVNGRSIPYTDIISIQGSSG